MELFGNDPLANLLPNDGVVHYFGPVLRTDEAAAYYETLLNTVPWKNDEVVIFGKHMVTARKTAWYGDGSYSYTYSGTTKQALAWTRELRALKRLAEERTGDSYNSCLLNLYHSGAEGMGWHSDDERSLGRESSIASLSLGAERKFCFRHKHTQQTAALYLENGSLLVMKGSTQNFWQHSLPKAKAERGARINLTFRSMLPQ